LLICAICEICGSKPDFAETPSSFAEASSFAKASADKTQDGRSSRFLHAPGSPDPGCINISSSSVFIRVHPWLPPAWWLEPKSREAPHAFA
ncbi:MAG: hypothetical protein ACKOE8_04380, partial [Opitutaceae bacterium]